MLDFKVELGLESPCAEFLAIFKVLLMVCQNEFIFDAKFVTPEVVSSRPQST